MRKKTIEMDGASFVIAPLTLDQVEQHITPIENTNDLSAARARAYDIVCAGLNNAQDGEGCPWDQARLTRTLDLLSFDRLRTEILQFSGLRLARGDDAGEAKAPAGN